MLHGLYLGVLSFTLILFELLNPSWLSETANLFQISNQLISIFILEDGELINYIVNSQEQPWVCLVFISDFSMQKCVLEQSISSWLQ